MSSALQLELIVSDPFQENTYLLHQGSNTPCVIVDPGFEPNRIVSLIRERHLQPAAILLTHGHVDHIAGNAALLREWPGLPLYIGTGDAPLLTNPQLNLSWLGGVSITSPPADHLVHDLEEFNTANFSWRVREIPGHSPGHIVYLLPQYSPLIVLGGDVLFQGSIGRCDFPGGDQELLVRGIREKLFCLPDDTIVYPGHGEPTTIGQERRDNPYCGESAGLYELE